MLDHELAQRAIEHRIQTVVVATTGSVTLAATATGYSRSSGSFVTDGFAAGMEITPSGFAANAICVVTAVSALTLTVEPAPAVQSAGAGRTLSANLPAIQDWGNVDIGTIPTGRPFIEAEYVPSPAQVLTIPAQGGVVEEFGLYVLRWYSPANVGDLALTRSAQALLALFLPGYTLALSDGTSLRWRENPAPWRGQVRLDTSGRALVVCTIPWRLYSTN